MTETRVLVTGGAGFIGSHVVDRLIDLGYSVAVVDDLSTGRREHINPKARHYQVNILSHDLGAVFEQERPQYVNHHAAQISVQLSLREPARDAEVNILGSLNVLENARNYGVKKFIYASSGGAMYGEPNRLPCDEGHEVRPLSPYGASKYALESYLYLYREVHGLNFTVLRYSNVYGPRQDPYGEAGVVAIFIQGILEGRDPVINGSGEQERDFVFVGDVVEANMKAMEKGDGEAFNIGTGYGASVNRIFGLLKGILNYGKDAAHGPSKPGEVFKMALDNSKARRGLDWAPQLSLEEGLQRTVDYFRMAQAKR